MGLGVNVAAEGRGAEGKNGAAHAANHIDATGAAATTGSIPKPFAEEVGATGPAAQVGADIPVPIMMSPTAGSILHPAVLEPHTPEATLSAAQVAKDIPAAVIPLPSPHEATADPPLPQAAVHAEVVSLEQLQQHQQPPHQEQQHPGRLPHRGHKPHRLSMLQEHLGGHQAAGDGNQQGQ